MKAAHKHRLVRLLLLGALLLIPVLSSPIVSRSAAAVQPSQVSPVPKDQAEYMPNAPELIESKRIQFAPRGSGAYLVWSERSVAIWPAEDTRSTMAASFDVMAQDMRTNKSFVVSDAPNNQTDPQISGSMVVWEDNRHSCPTCEYDIRGKDLATGAEFQVATGPVDQLSPAIAGTTVVWVEGDGITDTLMAKDLATENVMKIASVPRSTNTILHPLVSEEYIVWPQLGEDDQATRSYPVQVQAYDRKAGTINTITEFGLPFGARPEIALQGQRLVWQGFGSLNLTDLNSGATSVLYKAQAFSPALQADMVIWAVGSMTPGAVGFDIYGFNLKEEGATTVALVSDGATTGEAAVAGEQLVWQTKGGGNDGQMNMVPLVQAFATAPMAPERPVIAQSGNSTEDLGTNTPTPGLTPGPDSIRPDVPAYTNYNSKGIHAANGDFGWYNNGMYPTACGPDGGCPAVDALGATQGSPFFGAVTALSSDLDRYTTTNSDLAPGI